MSATIETADDTDYAAFIRRVAETAGVDLAAYKRKQMERRLRSLALRSGAKSLREFARMLEADPVLMEAFRRKMTINVSELFRNPEKFEELERVVLPRLAAGVSALRVWSAGCSYGAEPYSMAILLAELGPRAAGARVYATDIDQEMLARAREGVFPEADMKNVSSGRRRRFFAPDERGWRARPELRQRLVLRRHDLLLDELEAGWHLILCRNVVIYFTDEAKERLYRRLFASLAPGGVLFIGSTERIFGAEAIGYRAIGPFFYERPAEQDEGVRRHGDCAAGR